MFNFGGMSGGTGFQFGTTTSSNASTSNTGGLQSTGGGFNFGSKTTQAPAFGGFGSFGATTTTSNPLGSTPQFSFGSNLQQQPQQQPTLNLSFNAPATSTTLGAALSGGSAFSFGGNAQQPSTIAAPTFSGFNQAAASTAAPLFGAGSQAVSNTAAPASGFGGFSLGTAGGFGSQIAKTTANQPTFSFGAAASTPATFTAPAAPTVATTTAPSLAATPAFSFGAPQTATTTTAPTGGTQSLGGLLAGMSKSTAATTAATAFNLGAGFSSGGFGSTSASAATTSATTAAAVSATTTAAAPAATTAASLSGGFSLLTSTTKTTSAPSFLGGVVSSATTVAATTAAATISSSTTYAQLEEMVNRWSEELQEQEKVFLQQATQVNAWDRVLYENGEKIGQLNVELEKVKLDHQRLDHDLDLIVGQQAELQEALKPLEENVAQQTAVYAQQRPQYADVDRENIYKLTENIDEDLKKLSGDLKDVIEHINSSASSTDAGDNVMMQISKILNAHMDSLQWIDKNTDVLQRRVADFSQQLSEHQRSHNHNYSHIGSLYHHSSSK